MARTRSMSPCAPDQTAKSGKMRLEVHGQRRAQVVEARVHLAGYRAAMGALDALGGQQMGFWFQLGEVLRDRERVPDLGAIVVQAGHQKRRRQQQELRSRRGIIGGHRLLDELQAGHLAEQPAAQRPGRVVLAADRKYGCCHSARPSLVAASRGANASPVSKTARHPPQDALAFVRCTIGSRAGSAAAAARGLETTCSILPTKPIPTWSNRRSRWPAHRWPCSGPLGCRQCAACFAISRPPTS